jgi:hypothetical protein
MHRPRNVYTKNVSEFKGLHSEDTHPAKVQNEPATGMKAAISPRDSMVMKTMAPTMAYEISIDAGPPVARLFPVPKNNPVPIVPGVA